ncbi:MAG: class A beta-lactamase-related serine hydrolase [Actinobacteria bacterium]|nr:class A beta-lactamase-related serine hydrolase [Actinomycetota bacterium]
MADPAHDLAALFAMRGADGALHAVDLSTGRETGHNSDDPVVLASVFKIPVMLELARQTAARELNPTDRITVRADRRVLGPTGLSVMLDDAELSIRDLALLMMSVSDNTATDVLMEIVGIERVNTTLRELGLVRTVLRGDCGDILQSILDDLGVEDLEEGLAILAPERLRDLRALDPSRTSATTPREMTTLLGLIWTDRAGPPEACAEVRRIMALQAWPHRLRSGFPDGVATPGKTGTLPGLRNESGVVEYPDGARFAVAVFTRVEDSALMNPPIDALIGEAAALAVGALREPSA